ncbi:MAG: ABC transporter permease [Pseudomonadota bacterium]
MLDRQAVAPQWIALGRGFLGTSAFVLTLLILWEYLINSFNVPPFVMPAPAEVLTSFREDFDRISEALVFTLRSGVIGLICATILALILAASFAASDLLSRAFLPLVIFVRTAPVLAIAPILILIFGRGVATSVVVVIIVAFFPIMVNALRGFRTVEHSMLELMHVCGASRPQVFLKIRLPSSLPFIFTGLRAASASSLLAVMLAEWLSVDPGLGTLILKANSYRELGLLWAAVLTTMATAFVIFATFASLERRLARWSI